MALRLCCPCFATVICDGLTCHNLRALLTSTLHTDYDHLLSPQQTCTPLRTPLKLSSTLHIECSRLLSPQQTCIRSLSCMHLRNPNNRAYAKASHAMPCHAQSSAHAALAASTLTAISIQTSSEPPLLACRACTCQGEAGCAAVSHGQWYRTVSQMPKPPSPKPPKANPCP